MSNILSRKGLALGAVVALAASFFGGTAAFAADEVTLVPSGTVTTTKTIEDQKFSLLAGLAPSVPIGNVVSLEYQVVTADTGVTVEYTSNGTATAAATTTFGSIANTVVYKPATPTSGLAQGITLKATSVAAATPKTATVIAFLDSTPNNTKDAGEWASAPITITWVDATDLAPVITLTAPLAGDTEVNASIEIPGINLQQVQGSFGAVFSNNNLGNVGVTNGATSGAGATSAATATTSASTGKVAVSKTATNALVKGSLVKVQATFASANIGDSVLAAAADRAITTITLGAPAAAGVVTGTVGSGIATTSTAGSIVVKTNTGFSVVISVGGASVPVAVSVSASSGAWSTTTGATINGVAYTDKAKLPGASGIDKLALTSGANGTVTIPVTTVGLVSTNALTFTVVSQNITASTVVTEQDSTYSIYDADDVTNTGNRAVVAKGTLAVNFVVIDQFGVAPADATYRLAVSATQGAQAARTTGINQAYYPAITAGKAAVSVVDNGAGIGKADLIATLQKVGTDGNYAALSTNVAKTIVVNFTSAAAAKVVLDTLYNIPSFGSAHVRSNTNLDTDADTDTTDSLDIPTVLKLSPKDFKAYNANLDKTATATAVDTTYAVNVSGTITLGDTGATVVPGSAITVSGAGLEFVASNGSTGIGSLSGFAKSDGTFSFSVYSHTVGKQTITITSGTGSATLSLTFKADATSGTALAFGSTVAAQAQTGRALDVSVVVTDKWGNIVEGASVAFSSTGAGYINNESVIKSSSKGVSSAKLIAGSSDLGTAYVTATLSDPATAVTLSKSIELGETSVDAVAGGKRVFANVEFAKGKTVTVTIDGVRKYSKVADTDNALELAFTQKKAGKHTVTVRAGSVVTTEVVVTK